MQSRIVLFLLLLFPTLTWAQKLIILHTNDHHGAYMANNSGNYGLAAQATIVKQVREQAAREGKHVLVLSAGDINTGAPESNMFQARPDIEAMNAIGYDALVVGNHEFDVTPDELSQQRKLANFEFLGANIKTEDGSHAFTPYIVKDVGGKKVAIIGLTTSETPHMSSAINRPGLTWSNPVESEKALIKQLKKDYDMVIALSHLGFIKDEKPGQQFPGDISLAKANPDIDVIIGGHSHTELKEGVVIGETSIFQAKESGEFLGRVEVDLSGKKPKILGSKLIPVKDVIPDQKVASILRPYMERAGKELNERVGYLRGKMPGGRGFLKVDDSPLGNLLAEANREAAAADIGISNARGLRTGLEPGDISIRDLTAVSPFNNTVTYVDLTSDELWKTVNILNEKYLQASNQNVYFSRGFEVRISNGVVSEIVFKGEPVAKGSKQKFRLALGNFLSEMVTDFDYIKHHQTFVNTGETEVRAMAEYFKARGTLDVKDLTLSNHVKLDDCNYFFLSK